MEQDVRIQLAVGEQGRKIVARILPGTDLFAGIEAICQNAGIKYGTIDSCLGSLSKSGYVYIIPLEKEKIGAGYGDLHQLEEPIELLNGTGFVCRRDNKYDIHFHATMCDKDGKVFGGHLVKGENIVLATVDIGINEINGVEMNRKYDLETNLILFDPKKKI